MRLSILFVVGSCYRAGELRPTDGATPDDVVMPGDGVGDTSTADGPFSTCVTSQFLNAGLVGLNGTSYTRNVSSFALFEDNATIQQVSAPGSMAFASSIPGGTYTRPVLATSTVGSKPQAFFVRGFSDLVKATLNTGTVWDTPTDVQVIGLLVDNTFVLGQPTGTIPRHVTASSNGQIFEGIENGSTLTFTALSIPGAVAPIHPSLSKDGLAVVFVEQAGGTRLYRSERANLTSPFTMPIALGDQPANVNGNEAFPSFGHDCDRIFLSTDSTIIEIE